MMVAELCVVVDVLVAASVAVAGRLVSAGGR